MKQALLVIDVQNDYFKEGKMPLQEPMKALRTINQLEEYFNENKLPIIYIQHVNEKPDADFFVRDTVGVQLHSELAVIDQSIVLKKQYPNSFLHTSLQEVLEKLAIEQVVITGMMTHMCIDSTTRASAELGYQPIVIADATATKEMKFSKQTISACDVGGAFLAALTTFSKVVLAKAFLENAREESVTTSDRSTGI